MQNLIHTCSISRRQAVGTNGRRAMSPLVSGVPCLAIPMSTRATIENKFEIGRGYDFFFNETQDVRPGDQITYNANTYAVSAVQDYAVPIVGHLHVLAQQEVA